MCSWNSTTHVLIRFWQLLYRDACDYQLSLQSLQQHSPLLINIEQTQKIDVAGPFWLSTAGRRPRNKRRRKRDGISHRNAAAGTGRLLLSAWRRAVRRDASLHILSLQMSRQHTASRQWRCCWRRHLPVSVIPLCHPRNVFPCNQSPVSHAAHYSREQCMLNRKIDCHNHVCCVNIYHAQVVHKSDASTRYSCSNGQTSQRCCREKKYLFHPRSSYILICDCPRKKYNSRHQTTAAEQRL